MRRAIQDMIPRHFLTSPTPERRSRDFLLGKWANPPQVLGSTPA
jgi:hypothetical protein